VAPPDRSDPAAAWRPACVATKNSTMHTKQVSSVVASPADSRRAPPRDAVCPPCSLSSAGLFPDGALPSAAWFRSDRMPCMSPPVGLSEGGGARRHSMSVVWVSSRRPLVVLSSSSRRPLGVPSPPEGLRRGTLAQGRRSGEGVRSPRAFPRLARSNSGLRRHLLTGADRG
jgi:hypothetical protein